MAVKRYSVTDAADKIGVSRVTVHRYIQRGVVTPDRVGGIRLLSTQDINALKRAMGRR